MSFVLDVIGCFCLQSQCQSWSARIFMECCLELRCGNKFKFEGWRSCCPLTFLPHWQMLLPWAKNIWSAHESVCELLQFSAQCIKLYQEGYQFQLSSFSLVLHVFQRPWTPTACLNGFLMLCQVFALLFPSGCTFLPLFSLCISSQSGFYSSFYGHLKFLLF